MKESHLIPEKKNILFLISSIGGGGAERVACRLVSEFSKRHKVYLMYFFKKEKEYSVDKKVTLIPFINQNKQKNPTNNRDIISQKIIRIKQIEKIRKIYKIDVTISFLYGPNIYNITAGGGSIKIASERNDPEGKGEEYFNDMVLAYQKSDKVVFQTKYVKDKFPEDIKKKSIIIPNPISISCLSDMSFAEKKIVSVGRLVPQKNQALLIKAFANFKRLHNGYHLYIYGIGPLLDELKLLSKQYNLEEFIHFEGFEENIHEKIKNAEQFIFSSDYEGLPNALMEAMMMGLPCISTKCSGIGEIINDGINGLLVPIGNVSALSRKMCLLSDDKKLQKKLRRGARIKSEEWKTERIAKKWESLFL